MKNFKFLSCASVGTSKTDVVFTFSTVASKVGSRGGGGGMPPTQVLADQLTLSQPRGAHYSHPLLCAPGFPDLTIALTSSGILLNLLQYEIQLGM
jgi:hypothetical protein